MRGLEAAVQGVLDRRLRPDSPRPLAVALSGGGDSVALTLIADAWARTQGRDVLILTVDHGLQPESCAWTRRCAALAARLGRPFQALAWEGHKPATGLPAAARLARHRLLADTARDAGARVLLMGHTADDIAESRTMRAAGSTTPDARAWAPSPAWPEGRGLFVLRPMLEVRRPDLRAWLEARGEAWIDDPANDDPRYARARARAAGAPIVPSTDGEPPSELARLADHAEGGVTLQRRTARRAPIDDLVRFVGLACVCAGGGDRRPASARLRRVADALQGEGDVVATLAGARVAADGKQVEIFREAGEFRRRDLQPLPLPPGQGVVWDGRVVATARRPGLTLRAVAGVAARLPPAERTYLAVLAPGLRATLPVAAYPDGAFSLPGVGQARHDVAIEDLVRARFEAAAGLVQREPA